MGKLQVLRKPTVTNTQLDFDFSVIGVKYLVKNFTDGDIYVSFDNPLVKAESILIPSESSQVIVCKELSIDGVNYGSNKVTVMPDFSSTKGVEVQCILW